MARTSGGDSWAGSDENANWIKILAHQIKSPPREWKVDLGLSASPAKQGQTRLQ